MQQFTIKYALDERPPLMQTLIFSLQWLAITVATVIIIGKVVAGLHFTDFSRQLLYMQKLFFVMALALFVQVLWGHRLPLITGPATVLLVAFGKDGFIFQDGLIICIPMMVSILVSYLPAAVKGAFPPLLMPVIGNGFVMGVLAVLALEHVVYRRKICDTSMV